MEQSPPDFIFAVKASRYLTHVKRLTLDPYDRSASTSRSSRSPRAPSSGRCSGSCRANFHRDTSASRARWRRCRRDATPSSSATTSWFTDEVYRLLRDHGAALVIGDESSRWVSTPLVRTADWTFVRFHHGSRGRHGNYSDSELDDVGAPDRPVAPRHRGLRLLQQRLGGLRDPQRPPAEGASSASSAGASSRRAACPGGQCGGG